MTKDQFHSLFNSPQTPSSFQNQGSNLYSKVDPNNTGNISLHNFVSGMPSNLG